VIAFAAYTAAETQNSILR